MQPPIYETAKANAGVTALLGAPEPRFFAFGNAPPGIEKPYAVWRHIFGSPENYLGDLPDIDSFGIQVDTYAVDGATARTVSAALQAAFEPVAHVTSYGAEIRDSDTLNFSTSFVVEWINNR